MRGDKSELQRLIGIIGKSADDAAEMLALEDFDESIVDGIDFKGHPLAKEIAEWAADQMEMMPMRTTSDAYGRGWNAGFLAAIFRLERHLHSEYNVDRPTVL
ncbi:MAG: hypothetical protein OXC91_02805 [Rhodobacteraceae bacterium]|nr:hypothetical protein [Paracoccaceae bacterium]